MLDLFRKMGGEQPNSQLISELHDALGVDIKKSQRLMEELFAKEDPSLPAKVHELIRDLAREQKLSEMTLLGEGYVQWSEADAEVLNLLGNAARKVGRWDRAEQFYSKALGIKKSYEFPLYNLAATYAKVPIFDQTVVDLVAPLKKERDFILPDFRHPADLITEVTAQLKIGGQTPSEKDILLTLQRQAKELQVHPSDEDRLPAYHKALYNLGLAALRFKEYEKAIEYFEILNKQKSSIPFVLMLRGLALFNAGKKAEGLQILEALAKAEKNRYHLINLGQMYKRASNSLLAYRFFIEAAKLLKKTHGLFRIEDILKEIHIKMEQGQPQIAIELIEAIKDETERADLLSFRVDGLMKMEKYDEAFPLLEIMLANESTRVYATNKLTECYTSFSNQADINMHQERVNLAIQYFEKALKIMRSQEMLLKAAKAYKAKNDMLRHNQLMEEYNYRKSQQERRDTEQKQQEFIEQGKVAFKEANYEQSIRYFEEAFRLGVSNEAFSYLEKIFTFLNRKKALTSLQTDWNRKLKHGESQQAEKNPFDQIKTLL